MKCVRCGKEIDGWIRFCTNCGALVAESGNPEAAAPSPERHRAVAPPAVPSPSGTAPPDGGTAGAPAEAPGKQAAPSCSQNNPEAVALFILRTITAQPRPSPRATYYPLLGSPQGPMPPKTSNKLILGLVWDLLP